MRRPLLRALDRKVLRDLWRMRGPLLAIAGVIGCGLGLYLGLRTTLLSLDGARASYYAEERFADVFAGLRRAPERVAQRLRAIPGVQRLQTRVMVQATLDVEGMSEAVSGRLVSLPDSGAPEVNGVRLRSGRLPRAGAEREVLLGEGFAKAHALVAGDELGAVLHGRWQRLRVVGTALSPEFTYAVGPGMLFPDDRRYGVIWMRREPLASAFDLEGAFNDVALGLARGAREAEVLARVDAVLAPYGGVGAIARADQQSAFFVNNELAQLRSFGTMVPLVFLAVAAFLVHIVIGRVVASQREQIASLKALGYRDRDIGVHFVKLIGAVVLLGSAAGIALAAWVGSGMTELYTEYYRFPALRYRMDPLECAQAIGFAAAAAALGAAGAVLRTVRLPPAEAMRPAAPHSYRPALLERSGLQRFTPPAVRIVLRELERSPLRAAMSVLGIALAAALMVMSTFSYGSIGHLINVHFGLASRAAVQLTLFEPRATSGMSALEQLPGVVHAEPFRSAPVKLRAGARFKNSAILGVPAQATLHAVLDAELRTLQVPPEGVVLSRKLAELLGVAAGDALRVELLEGARRERSVTVARVAETFIGLSAYMELGALCALLGEGPSLSGAWLSVDSRALPALHAAVKRTPAIAGISVRDTSLQRFRALIAENLGRSVAISVVFSLVLALGVLYNAARIALAERARDLASLRVLGFRRSEVAAILLGELGLLVALALPLGLWIGHGLVAVLSRTAGMNSEQFRIPEVITPATDAGAVLTVLAAALLAGWNAWRALDRMDIADVLKSRD